jgi:hypothetical protein
MRKIRDFQFLVIWGAMLIAAAFAQQEWWPSDPQRIRRLIFSLLFLCFPPYLGYRGVAGIIDGRITYGRWRPITVERDKNPVAFWIAIATFAVISVFGAITVIDVNFLPPD